VLNNTVTGRISYILADINEHTIEKMKNSFSSTLQVEDETRSNGKCYMIGFVRFVTVIPLFVSDRVKNKY